MRRLTRALLVLVGTVGLVVGPMGSARAQESQKLTYVDLVKRLTDLEALAVLPAAGEKCQQWSSYDRLSAYDEKTGKYVRWGYNADDTGIIRKEGQDKVFAEMEGPGVIWRIWAAKTGSGHVKVFLDGAAEPAIDLPFSGYFDGTNPPFQGKALCHTIPRKDMIQGQNCFVPIPYQKSCKVVAEKDYGWDVRAAHMEMFYHFTYTTYPKGTVLPTFKLPLSAEDSAALAKANDFLENKLGTDPAGPRAGDITEEKSVSIEGGKTVRLWEITGARAITALRVKFDPPKAPEDQMMLRELCLRMTWDGERQPAVWAPLGDFFGSIMAYRKYRSLPLGVTDDGDYSLWYMPFARSAVVELVNDGTTRRDLTFQITHAPLTRPVETLGRFHAKWHRDAFLPEEPERRKVDWTLLKTSGRGRYVGVMLHVWNPVHNWWGEGDEKFFIDGEKFPSTFGTGTEDYFGYAFGLPYNSGSHAYHNLPYTSTGLCCVSRWQIADQVPFTRSFEGAFEKFIPQSVYAATPFFYLAAGQEDGYPEATIEERTVYWQRKLPGVLEGEDLKVLEKTAGETARKEMGPGWSDYTHLLWTGGKPGDKLTLELPVEAEGKYKVVLQMTRGGQYDAIVQLHLDGQKLGEAMDLYAYVPMPTGALDMGLHALQKGAHRLTIEIVGANEKSKKSYTTDLDYVKLEPVK